MDADAYRIELARLDDEVRRLRKACEDELDAIRNKWNAPILKAEIARLKLQRGQWTDSPGESP